MVMTANKKDNTKVKVKLLKTTVVNRQLTKKGKTVEVTSSEGAMLVHHSKAEYLGGKKSKSDDKSDDKSGGDNDNKSDPGKVENRDPKSS